MRVLPHEPEYPRAALDLARHIVPPALTLSGPLERGHRVVAIVGSREAEQASIEFAHRLAYDLANVGIIVASGGAKGVDAAAHNGALDAGGTTWLVACTGRDAGPYPEDHVDLFNAVASSDTSRMIWPFPDDQPKTKETPRFRNGILTSLACAVVVIQARIGSGSINAATWARRLERPLYVVPGRPWDDNFIGSNHLISRGAIPLLSERQLFIDLRLPTDGLRDPAPHYVPPRHLKEERESLEKRAPKTLLVGAQTPEENLIQSVLSEAPTHQDKIIAKSELGASSTLTALLTLSLRDVVVEGPDGFFRLKKVK